MTDEQSIPDPRGVNTRPVSNLTAPDISAVKPLTQSDLVLLKEIRQVLAKHGALERFGVTLQHQHFELADDEVMVESADVENRVQTIRSMKRSQATSVIETAWIFGSGDGAKATLQCWLRCYKGAGGLHFIQHQP
jgi:hypothetical protein